MSPIADYRRTWTKLKRLTVCRTVRENGQAIAVAGDRVVDAPVVAWIEEVRHQAREFADSEK